MRPKSWIHLIVAVGFIAASIAAEREDRTAVWTVSLIPLRPDTVISDGHMQVFDAMKKLGLSLELNKDTRILRADLLKVGIANVTVRDPAGKLLASVPVDVILSKLDQSSYLAVRLSGYTDIHGRFRVPLPPGVQSLRVSVPGVGLGDTGRFELAAGKSVDVTMPPLAGFGQVEGSVDPALVAPDAIVSCSYAFTEYARAPIAKDGHFIIHDLPPGPCGLNFKSYDKPDSASAGIEVLAGKWVRGVKLQQRDWLTHDDSQPHSGADAATPVPGQLRGTVRDAEGKQIVGATVWCNSLSSLTDARGEYLIHGDSDAGTLSLVVVRADGYCPMVVPRRLTTTSKQAIPKMDFVLHRSGGELEITVLNGRSPVPDEYVHASLAGAWHFPGRYTQQHFEGFEQVSNRDEKTDKLGVARFHDLLPGRYDIGYPDPQSPFSPAILDGIAVSGGKKTKLTMADYRQRGDVSFRVLDPDGNEVSRDQFEYRVLSASGDEGGTSTRTLEHGLVRDRFQSPGIRTVYLRYRDTSILDNWCLYGEPFYEAWATVAVSNLRWDGGSINVTAIRHEAGSLQARLLDLEGKPVRGTVILPDWSGAFERGGTTDADGRIVFPSLVSGITEVGAQIPGAVTAPTPDVGLDPKNEPLFKGVVSVPVATVRIKSNSAAHVVMQPKRMGYITGRLTAPIGIPISDCRITHLEVDSRFLTDDDKAFVAEGSSDVLIDNKTGRFIIGPLQAGELKLSLSYFVPNQWEVRAGTVAVMVVGGEVTHQDLKLESAAKPQYVGTPMFGALGLGSESPAQIFVYEEDGKTPVQGAWVETFLPDTWWPYQFGTSDQTGRTFIGADGWGGSGPKFQPTGSPDHRVLVAWLPGERGAAVLPIEPTTTHLSALLPPPISARGHVTVAGKSPDQLEAVVHVFAAHEDEGNLGEAISVHTTCSTDGTFDLKGLTPGKYRIQASLDDVWLSPTVEMIADPKHPIPPLSLNIPAPGVDVIVHLVDKNGAPQKGMHISIERPQGPLTDRVWPGEFVADGAGIVYIDGLDAGDHIVVLAGGRRESFSVPEPVDGSRLPVPVRIFVRP